MHVYSVWAWSCGKSTPKVLEGHCLSACFTDTVLISFPALCTLLCTLSLSISTKRGVGGYVGRRKQNLVERCHCLEFLAAAVLACTCASVFLDWKEEKGAVLIRLLHARPHAAAAGVIQGVCWAASLAAVRSVIRRASSRSMHFPLALLLLWLAQAMSVAVAAGFWSVRSRPSGSVQRAQIALLTATAGCELCFALLAVWEELHLRKIARLWQMEAARMPSLASLLLDDSTSTVHVPLEVPANPFWGLAFSWVSPLMQRGAKSTQLHLADLFELPGELYPKRCFASTWRAWTKERQEKDHRTAESGRLRQASLLLALARVYGWPYVALGTLKLANDFLNFAGPVLLNLLVSCLDDKESQGGHSRQLLDGRTDNGAAPPQFWRRYEAYILAVLLGVCALFKAVLDCQYSFLKGKLSCRLQTSITCMVFAKSLTMSSVQSTAFGAGAVQTLMSVDADRVVNLCASLHELWSLPLQIAAALVLLYTQVRFAFVAGLGVVLLLIPLNRWLAVRIEAASATMMACKDLRIKRIGELLKGIRQIKVAAWEASFVNRVSVARNGELQALAVRKYLDAMCVYFWAATPILMSLLTFGLFALLGHELTATVVFTSLALFNVLIAPLNSFPWVINGVVEAVVSVRRLQRFLTVEETKAEWAYKTSTSSQAGPRDTVIGFEFDAPPTPTFNTPLLHTAQGPNSRFSLGSSDSIDIPRKANRHLSAGAFGSADQLQTSFAVMFDCASFSWQPASPGPQIAFCGREGAVLQGVDLAIPQGSLTVIVGEVGSGKSSLLAAALGEMTVVEGQVSVFGSMAFVGQQPWVFSGTIRNNILFGKAYDAARYQSVVRACALEQDIQRMRQADLTPIGDRGATLSGGQRARVALARALYQDADVYFLDNVLAAVDPPVAAWLVQNAICGPLLQHKTRILCTHSPACIRAADAVVLMRGGRAVLRRPHHEEDLRLGCRELEEAPYNSSPWPSSWVDKLLEESSAASGAEEGGQIQPTIAETSLDQAPPDDEVAKLLASPAPALPVETSGLQEIAQETVIQQEEERHIGHVKWSVYRFYTASVGPLLTITILVSLLMMQASRNGSDVWLSLWVSRATPEQLRGISGGPSFLADAEGSAHASSDAFQPLRTPVLQMADWWREGHAAWGLQAPLFLVRQFANGSRATVSEHSSLTTRIRLPEGVAFYLSILLMFAACNSLFTLIRAFSFAGGGLRAAEKMHSVLLRSVVRSPASLFDNISTGRILNRFSSDTATADDSLPFIANILVANLASLVGVVAVLAYSQPLLVVMLLPLAVVYCCLQRYYRHTSREVRRLGSVARSPVYAGFSEVLEGAPTIRAFGHQPRFVALNEATVAAMQRTALAGIAVASWLSMRLQLMAAVLVTGVALMAALAGDDLLPRITRQRHGAVAGLVGLSLSYALPITGLLSGLLMSSAETEQEMVAVERIAEYCRFQPQVDTLPPLLPAAESACSTGSSAADDQRSPWPGRGRVRFRSAELRYQEGGPLALAGVDLSIAPGENVGVIGRTGAGKSSLVSALLRLSEISAGAIVVDGKDIREVPLRTLRRGIALVPQTPFLFEGSIRQNLDPLGEYLDRDMIRVLKDVHLWEILCGISLSQAKEGESPRSAARQQQAQSERGMPSSPQARRSRAAPQLVNARLSRTSPGGASSSPRDIVGRPPIGGTQNSYNSPRSSALGHAASASSATLESLGAVKKVAVRGRSEDESAKSRVQLSFSAPVFRPGMPRGGLCGSLRTLGLPAEPVNREAAGSEISSVQEETLLEATGRMEAQAGSSDKSGQDRLPALRPVATSRRSAAGRLQQRHRNSPTSFSRFLGLSGWVDSLAAEAPEVLLHAGFGIQILSMRVGAGGLGLSQGQQQLLCLARALLRKPSVVCLDECTASADPRTAATTQQLIQEQLRGATVLQVAHHLESVMQCDRVVVMEAGSIIEEGTPSQLLRDKTSHFSCMRRAQKGQPVNA